MKVLTLTQPWATLLVTGEKRIETRSWTPAQNTIGTVIAIHAAKGFPVCAKNLCAKDPFRESLSLHGYTLNSLPLGAIVGACRIVSYCSTDRMEYELSKKEFAFGNYDPHRYAWQMSDFTRLVIPFSCRGGLSLCNLHPDVEKLAFHGITLPQ